MFFCFSGCSGNIGGRPSESSLNVEHLVALEKMIFALSKSSSTSVSWITFSIQYVLYWCIISFLTQSYLSALRLKERLYPCPTSDATKGDKDPFSGRILKVLLLHLLGACEKYKQSIYWSMSAHVFCQITEFDCPPIICNPLVMSLLYRAQQFSGSTTG